MKLIYTFSEIGKENDLKTREEAIKATDEAAKAIKELTSGIGGLILGKHWWGRFQIWLLSSCYKKTLTEDYIEYNFWLLGLLAKITNKKAEHV